MIILLIQAITLQLPASGDSTNVEKDTLSKFDATNKKMEALFKILPVPIFSYTTEAGYTFGLAKYNLLNLSKSDTISSPSKISEVVAFSTKGQVNISVSSELAWNKDKYLVMGYINYKRQPEYILGIGNDVKLENAEKITLTRLKFVNYGLVQVYDNLYLGIGVDLTNYTNIEKDSASFLIRDSITGVDGVTSSGMGFSAAYDTRDNRYNPYKGMYCIIKSLSFPSFMGNPYLFSSYDFDVRKYFNPWKEHVIAMQATTSYRTGEVPFYELAMLGGEDEMRGYYKGALRDNVLVDCQVEYRMPV